MGLDYLGPIILVTSLNNVFGVSVPCGETYLAKNGHRCYPCSAGYYKVSDCVKDGEQSRCKPCGYGEYLPTCDNSTQCNPCDLFCHGGQVQIKACTPTSNLKCQCKGGYYWKPDPDRICLRHRKCNPGEGLKTKGTPYEDTICEPCKNGTSYSSLTSYNKCTPCSVCNITQRSCNSIHDTVCGSKAKGTTNTPEADSGKSWVIPVAVVVGVFFFVVVVVFLCIRHVRRRNIKLFEEEKPEHVEQGLGNDFSSTHIDTIV
ncbi:tumor necrosis factor receptor superfamily member 5-like [Ruditapes philippinarum]|uniref:tumor necrosis factor receptor superfamily member 5-like n=1 Tax=Ruditapes philippinarum TaxID=129788 RepID=UPI00295B9800|nr:tumor necrosis factor receptor superfamily member 5-like [Ruditapes philippinarum]